MHSINNWKTAIALTETDEKTGLKLATLVDTPEISIHVVTITPGKTVNAHYHHQGIDAFHILEGEGVMYLSPAKHDNPSKKIDIMTLKAGDVFAVEPMTIHQLENKSKMPLTLLFTCPKSHLKEDNVRADSLLQATADMA